MRPVFTVLIVLLANQACQQAVSDVSQQVSQKIKGVAFTAPPKACTSEDFKEVAQVGANWINLIPYAFCGANNPEVQFNVDGQWWGEKKRGIETCIGLSRENDFKILVKPQLWLMGGKFTGDMVWSTEEEWKTFENSYERYIMDFAILSEQHKVEMLCIGTELDAFVQLRPAFWYSLIQKIKEVYSGKLTYAANWDEYPRVPFWKELDYVGVDAYFPLSDEKTPSISVLNAGWRTHKSALKKFSESTDRPLLFTEYGYRSMDNCASKPWESYTEVPLNVEAQANCYAALYGQFWDEPWFAGGFLWKWHSPSTGDTSGNASNYTPQGKPAAKVIIKQYGG